MRLASICALARLSVNNRPASTCFDSYDRLSFFFSSFFPRSNFLGRPGMYTQWGTCPSLLCGSCVSSFRLIYGPTSSHPPSVSLRFLIVLDVYPHTIDLCTLLLLHCRVARRSIAGRDSYSAPNNNTTRIKRAISLSKVKQERRSV